MTFLSKIWGTGIRYYSKSKLAVDISKLGLKPGHKTLPEWAKRQQSLKQRYGEWNPTRKLSRQQMQDVRNFLEQLPHLKTVDLAQYFNISPEAIRRILKSSWVPKNEDEIVKRDERRKARNRDNNKMMADSIDIAHNRLKFGQSSKFELVLVKNSNKYKLDRNKRKANMKLSKSNLFVKGAGDIIE